MNLFELLTVLAVLATAFLFGRILGSQFGLFGWLGGIILGLVAAIGGYRIFRRLVGVGR